MGTKLSDAGGTVEFNATAIIKEAGAKIVGTIVEKRSVTTQYGDLPVYSMVVKSEVKDDKDIVHATDCKFTKEKKAYEPAEGEKVDFFAPTRLERQLVQVAMGQTVSIKYLGTKKFGKGNPAHVFDVEVI